MKNFISSLVSALSRRHNVSIRIDNTNIGGNNRNGDTIKGAGPVVSDTRTLGAFNRLDVGGVFDVKIEITECLEPSVTVSAQENILPLVKTKVVGESLEITMSGNSTSSENIELLVRTNALAALTVHGSADVSVKNIKSGAFYLDVSGTADIKMSGQVAYLSADVSGSTGLNLTKTKVTNLQAHVSGTAHVQANVSEIVSLEVTGAASIVITGKPEKRNVNKSGVADIMFV